MVSHAWDGVPDEACGLVVGTTRGDAAWVARFEPTDNDARSARVYTIPPLAHLRIERAVVPLRVQHRAERRQADTGSRLQHRRVQPPTRRVERR